MQGANPLFHELSFENDKAGHRPGLVEKGKRIWRVGLARTRPLAESLSPRGPQPVMINLPVQLEPLNGPSEPKNEVLGFWYLRH